MGKEKQKILIPFLKKYGSTSEPQANNEAWFGFFEYRFNARNDATLIRSAINDTGGAIAVPEPSAAILSGLALVFGIGIRRRKQV